MASELMQTIATAEEKFDRAIDEAKAEAEQTVLEASKRAEAIRSHAEAAGKQTYEERLRAAEEEADGILDAERKKNQTAIDRLRANAAGKTSDAVRKTVNYLMQIS